MTHAHPQITRAKLAQLRPTQCTVGLLEVAQKRASWTVLKRKHRETFLEQHWFPSVIGPGNRYYIVDHHHLGRALIEEEIDSVFVLILKDLSYLEKATFWRVMEHHQWVHPFDEQGQRIEMEAIPKKIVQLKDDPYRSLAGMLRRTGEFSKDVTPYSEFLWADFLRSAISLEQIQHDIDGALKQAKQLAHQPEARYLPGWVPSMESTEGVAIR
jgi:hypothetical protein